MHAIDDEEVQAFRSGRLITPKQIRPGAWMIPVALPGTLMTTSFAYLLVDANSQGTMIDPGWDSDENWARLQNGVAAAGLGLSDIAYVVGTHLHPDHLGAAARVRAASGAHVVLLDREQQGVDIVASRYSSREADLEAQLDAWGVPDDQRDRARTATDETLPPSIIQADILAADGLSLPFAGDELEIIHTPGHTWGHVCVALHGRRLLFTGDHILPATLSALGIGDRGTGNPLQAYLDSLDELSRFEHYEICPGHGYRFTGLISRVEDIRARHNRRSDQVAAILEKEPDLSVWEVASLIRWSAGFENLSSAHLVSALTQTELHMDRVHESTRPRDPRGLE